MQNKMHFYDAVKERKSPWPLASSCAVRKWATRAQPPFGRGSESSVSTRGCREGLKGDRRDRPLLRRRGQGLLKATGTESLEELGSHTLH